jgi:hypothetical protein
VLLGQLGLLCVFLDNRSILGYFGVIGVFWGYWAILEHNIILWGILCGAFPPYCHCMGIFCTGKTTPCLVLINIPRTSRIVEIELGVHTQMKSVINLRRSVSHLVILTPKCRAMWISYTSKTTPCWMFINIPRTWRIAVIEVSLSAQTEALVKLRRFTSLAAIRIPNCNDVVIF